VASLSERGSSSSITKVSALPLWRVFFVWRRSIQNVWTRADRSSDMNDIEAAGLRTWRSASMLAVPHQHKRPPAGPAWRTPHHVGRRGTRISGTGLRRPHFFEKDRNGITFTSSSSPSTVMSTVVTPRHLPGRLEGIRIGNIQRSEKASDCMKEITLGNYGHRCQSGHCDAAGGAQRARL
jgi:hypothetical protein